MKKIFTKSDNFKQEYCCTIVRLGEIKPIEGKDVIGTTIVDNYSMIVNKLECHEGDIMFYAANESALNKEFLAANNLYEIGERARNANYEEVQKLINEGKQDEAKRLVGFFNKYGRVKMIRLGGTPSFGFLFSKETAARWKPELADIDLADYIGVEFDTILDEPFIKAYVPPMAQTSHKTHGKYDKRHKKALMKIQTIQPGEFAFHYDTKGVERNVHELHPDDIVDISIKCDGTSFIMGGQLKMRKPHVWHSGIKWLDNLLLRLYLNLPEQWQRWDDYTEDVYSSRHKIRSGNEFFNNVEEKVNVAAHDDKEDYPKNLDSMYPYYGKILNGKIPQGYTIYAEIVGYVTGTNTGIITRGGKVYDYGCNVGENKLMIYRVTSKHDDEEVCELNISDVISFTKTLVKNNPELKPYIMELPVVYHGRLGDLYPDLDVNNHWHENLVAAMKADKERFGMELKEPLCKNSVWREGIVIRIEDDKEKEAYKLKSVAYLKQESDDISKGIITGDIMEGYADDSDTQNEE